MKETKGMLMAVQDQTFRTNNIKLTECFTPM